MDYTILILDDNEIDYLITSKQLGIAFPEDTLTIEWLSNSQNIDYISLFSPYDICLIDQNMGDQQGLEIIQNMHRAGCMVPMILLTSENDKKVDFLSSECGATDYLVKDEISPPLLNRSIRFSLAQKKHERKLIALAYNDELTGIANRRKFDEFMEASLSSSARNPSPLSLILIDLDDFKSVNDTYGHLIGDTLLQHVAQRLTNAVRSTDLVARLGGDEFAIATTQLKDENGISLVLKKIEEIFASVFKLRDIQVSVTASIGAALKRSGEYMTFAELFRRADLSLYSAKFRGKNTTQLYSMTSFNNNNTKTKMPSRIRMALSNNEFKVLYQPKINIAGSSLCGVEALIRWCPKGRTPILPNNFIPSAEQSGDIIPIGEWVLDTACAQIRFWKDTYNLMMPVAVNMSPVHICQADAVLFIRNILKKYALAPQILEIEITETASFSDPTLLIRNLLQLHQLGCKIAIDDFGVGYSSFQRFIDLPVSSLKIDRSFIEKIGHSDKADATCKSIIALANALGIPVIAEGVETASQLRIVEQFNCQRAQGYFITEPLGADHFVSWLSKYEARHNIQPKSLLN